MATTQYLTFFGTVLTWRRGDDDNNDETVDWSLKLDLIDDTVRKWDDGLHCIRLILTVDDGYAFGLDAGRWHSAKCCACE
jgi:hypothetical protein